MRYVSVDEIKKRSKDVVLKNGALHRCFDPTELAELPTIEPKKVVKDYCRPRNLIVVAAEGSHRLVEQMLQTIDVPDRKFGEWIAEPNCWYRCSNCGQHYPSIRGYMDYKYCPNCGARMEGHEDV